MRGRGGGGSGVFKLASPGAPGERPGADVSTLGGTLVGVERAADPRGAAGAAHVRSRRPVRRGEWVENGPEARGPSRQGEGGAQRRKPAEALRSADVREG